MSQRMEVAFHPAANRYESMQYRRLGRSGLKLPVTSLGLWQNFGTNRPSDIARDIIRAAFDMGITHFDLANNYGPPYGSAEERFGGIVRTDFRALRDEIVVSTKAGYGMWDGPYGQFGSRKHLLASLDQSLSRLGLEYVDIFYSHRRDPETPLDETVGALAAAVHSGKALYVGVSSYSPSSTVQAYKLLAEHHVPMLVHQPSYSLFNRWIEQGLLDTLGELGVGCACFSPLAQGVLTDRYLNGIPEDSRAVTGAYFSSSMLSAENLDRVRALDGIARRRGQTLAQMAISWVLRDARVTTAIIGASSVEQLRGNVAAVHGTEFTQDELDEIDGHSVEAGVNLWAASSAID